MNQTVKPEESKSSLKNQQNIEISERMTPELLQSMTIGDMLSLALSSMAKAERNIYLNNHEEDKGNGTYARSIYIGNQRTDLDVPRTRSGEFKPSILPEPYQRSFSENHQQLLLGILSSSRSMNAAKQALRKMGVPVNEEELENLTTEFIEVLELHNTRPLETDYLAIYFDGKYVEIKEGNSLHGSCIYLVVGLGKDGRKQVLSCISKTGRENLEEWKKVLRQLIERGMRRPMIVIHDDFSGLLPVTKSLFPQSDIQLCFVHLQRNARSHLGKNEYAEFKERTKSIKACFNTEVASNQFQELCDSLREHSPAFIKHIEKNREHYLCFIKYPDAIRSSFSTTNTAECINQKLEYLSVNNGGYFHSEKNLKVKLGIQISNLESGKWKKPSGCVQTVLQQLNALFTLKFESEIYS